MRKLLAVVFGLVVMSAVSVAPASSQQDFKVHISVDMEGVAGVVNDSHTSSGGRNYAAAREQVIAETNAAISAAFDAGATEVVVVDSHGDKTNLQPAKLDRRATLISGGPRPLGMMAGIDASFAAAVFIGYHARASTADAILDHTYTGSIKGVWFDGVELGEGGLNAAVAGFYGVPVVFVSGDRAVNEEMTALIPNLQGVEVKEAIGRTAAHMIHPQEAVERIAAGVRQALEDRAQVAPLTFGAPVTLRIEVADAGQADQVMFVPGTTRAGSRTVEYVAPDAVAAYRVSRLVRLLAQ
jgi:D-amino peptidase